MIPTNYAIKIGQQLDSLTIFRNLAESPVMKKLKSLTGSIGDPKAAVNLYTDFVSELYRNCDNLSTYIYDFILSDENFYIKAKSKGERVDKVVEDAFENELETLQALSLLRASELKELIRYDGFLPDWNTTEYDFAAAYGERILNISHFGFGMFSKYHAFTVSDDGLIPVKYPDPVSLSSFEAYDAERELIIKNTQNLLKGARAGNVLLYGDAGTGKSSTVKAIANEYSGDGLRLVEIKKNQLYKLPEIIELLNDNPLKFIIFIDDLSFVKNDDNFTALKAHLEGGVAASGGNIAIYATSNRRHLVKESLADREGDDVHTSDTLQEIMSLAARFSLIITFQKPDKSTYLNIVRRIAKDYGLEESERLLPDAEAFALRNNGRSPRAAKQFVEFQKSELF